MNKEKDIIIKEESEYTIEQFAKEAGAMSRQISMEKREKTKAIFLAFIGDWEKLCKKSLLKYRVEENPYSFGYISGELKAIELMKSFIIEAWRK